MKTKYKILIITIFAAFLLLTSFMLQRYVINYSNDLILSNDLLDEKRKLARDNAMDEYRYHNIKTIFIPDMCGTDYVFIDENKIIYCAGNSKLILFDCITNEKKIIIINNKYKDNGMFAFYYDRINNHVYFKIGARTTNKKYQPDTVNYYLYLLDLNDNSY